MAVLKNMDLVLLQKKTKIINPHVIGFTLPGTDGVQTHGPTTSNSIGILGAYPDKMVDKTTLYFTFSHEHNASSLCLDQKTRIKTWKRKKYIIGYKLHSDSDLVETGVINDAYVLSICNDSESIWIFHKKKHRDKFAEALKEIVINLT